MTDSTRPGLAGGAAATPLADDRDEARRVIGATDAAGARARVVGGVAVALHDHVALPSSLSRSYADIDLVVEKGGESTLARTLAELGYEADRRFNALHGYRRMLFWDRANERQLDVFVGRFSMCHKLELSGRLEAGLTLTPADLLLTKLQIVELNPKDVVDALALVVSHEVGTEGDGDVIGTDRLAAITAADWGWYTTATDSLARIRERVDVAGPLAALAVLRLDSLAASMDDAPKSLRWRVRARVGRRLPWYELPEEHVR
jgi:hypothetical protein